MKSNFTTITFIFSLLFFCISCSDTAEDNFLVIQTQSSFDFHTITEYNGKLYATGGDIWNKSDLLTSDDGINWSIDSLTNKSVFDLYSTEEKLYGVGNDGYIFSGSPDLKLSRTKFWGLLRAFTSTGKTFVAVGGKDFNKGWIYKVNENLKVDTAFNYQHEIQDVWCSNDGNCIACGYGIILTSEDSGYSWVRSSETGDYYNSISISENGDAFIVGYNGTLIKSSDNGKTWQKLKDGHSPLSNNKPFRTIKFKSNNGIIAGDNGLIWITTNDGLDWTNISIDTNMDIFDFDFFGTQLIGVSESGRIIVIDL